MDLNKKELKYIKTFSEENLEKVKTIPLNLASRSHFDFINLKQNDFYDFLYSGFVRADNSFFKYINLDTKKLIIYSVRDLDIENKDLLGKTSEHGINRGDPDNIIISFSRTDKDSIETYRCSWDMKKATKLFSLDGYKVSVQQVDLSDNELRPVSVKLKQNSGVVFGQEWMNGLKVKMVPFADGKMASSWEVRVKDYTQFTRATRHRAPSNPLFPQKPDHPVVGVNRSDAVAFCKWLTAKERKEDRIRPRHEYRLPTDVEWSLFCGLADEPGTSPVGRYYNALQNPGLKNLYPWGKVFPPKIKVANLADKDAAKAAGIPNKRIIAGYADGFTNTAPVGSFEPNKLGMHDVSGNVFEWIQDPYSEGGDLGVVRGGSWATFQAKDLKSWSRFPVSKAIRDNLYGFRVVLVDNTQEVETTPEAEE